MLEYDDRIYRYVHDLRGGIGDVLDTADSLIVEYKYDV